MNNNHEKQQDRDIDNHNKSTEDPSSSSSSSVPRLTDLFVGDGDNDEWTVTQCLQTLDLQVTGACRADERLKPFLKLNVSTGLAEDRLLSYLTQHFEPSEVGLLARCMCVPLVSVRVGKIDKQGTLLVPNSARGNLTLSLLPTSDLHISFHGDDGRVERISTLRNISDCSSAVIEGISADDSGRSFMIKVPASDEPFYFWCSEKSRLLGNELLNKMRNLLGNKSSLSDLTGISHSRLEHFVTHLRTYLGSDFRVNNTALVSLTSPTSTTSLDLGETSLKNTAASSPSCTSISTTLNQSFNAKIPELNIDTHKFPLVIGLEVGLADKTVDARSLSSTPPISPYYCWCSPVASTLQYTVAPSQITADPFTLPPLISSSLSSNLLTPNTTLNLDEFPPFLPIAMPASQQIPIFAPLMTDPIVHIPVIDMYSSGQACLMSVGPAMNVTLLQEADSVAEKSARDTLRLLISGSSQVPSVHANVDNVLASGSSALYGDVNHAILGVVSPSEKFSDVIRRCLDQGDLVNLLSESVDSGGTCSSTDDPNLGAGKS